MSKALRILYAVGPENVIDAYNYWVKGEDAPSQVSVPYSSQFYEVCQTLNAQGYVIAQSTKKQMIRDELFIVESRRVPLPKASGIVYHLRQIWYGLHLLQSAIRFRANVVIASTGTTYWFVFSLFSWLGIKVIPSVHCTLWCKYLPVRKVDQFILALSRNLFTTDCQAIMTVSHDISQQISQLTGERHRPILEFFPTFRRADFAGLDVPPKSGLSFSILFAGRIEKNKGVFDLLEIAKRFAKQGIKDITFHICGTGSALESLRLAANKAQVDDSFICHGYCTKPQMREMFNRSHVVVVPTRKDFIEGFNRVVCESILSGRPVVTSSVCPALSYMGDAVFEVPPNDTLAYGDALLTLYEDKQLYEQKRQACLQVQEQFYEMSKSWGAALKSILLTIEEEQQKSNLITSIQQ
ncbi:MAG: glycosyltransferase family 4 protein [Nostocales cyanobacterium 94392]|nr:glycosyltransferase family 4 protein [Nostocales cyanobacterium 94392]